ncbi:carbohydrate ABC transporter permease [Microbacterium oryzae]|uniref:carbohydrate ABC transporter permease n=1 Tax=Microbacterium oryzae TaxID=743009 RepID=UPI0025AF2399|nr:carbohydrate ABC transporter permease [Microbacterium oryzae]MDN3310466.1 carbohydrate ABC transporter permease [Microbacterium oryzae]
MVLGVFTFITLIPLLWLIVSSFKTNNELFTNPFGLPASWSFDNYVEALSARPLPVYLLNSLVAAGLSAALIIVASMLASYALMHRFPLRQVTFGFLMFGILLPVNALMTPIFFIVNIMGLYNTILGLALVYAGLFFPLGFLIIKTYMDTTPPEILEAARLDGAGFHSVFARIVAPLTAPGAITAGIFLLITAFNELLFASILTEDAQAQTIQVGVRYFLTTYSADYPLAFAATVISIAPTIVIYILLSDRIVAAMTAGSLK